jgi:hypothetical protein
LTASVLVIPIRLAVGELQRIEKFSRYFFIIYIVTLGKSGVNVIVWLIIILWCSFFHNLEKINKS